MVNWFYLLSFLNWLMNLDVQFVVVLAALVRVLGLWGWSGSRLRWNSGGLCF